MIFRRILAVSLIAVGVLGIAGIVAEMRSNPLRRSDGEIREWILQKAPLGCTKSDVMAVIAKEGWHGHPEFRGARRDISAYGVTFYGADLGSYQRFPWRCRADAFWSLALMIESRTCTSADGARDYELATRKA